MISFLFPTKFSEVFSDRCEVRISLGIINFLFGVEYLLFGVEYLLFGVEYLLFLNESEKQIIERFKSDFLFHTVK